VFVPVVTAFVAPVFPESGGVSSEKKNAPGRHDVVSVFGGRCAGRRPESRPQSRRHLRQLSRHGRQQRGRHSGLAGMSKSKMLGTMGEFRSGAKPATIMHQLSKGYTDASLT
jgi:hypothetical protein